MDIYLEIDSTPVIIEVKQSKKNNKRQRYNQIRTVKNIKGHNPAYILIWNTHDVDYMNHTNLKANAILDPYLSEFKSSMKKN